MSKDQVLALLPKLKREELEAISVVLNQLLDQKSDNDNVNLWLDAVNAVLGLRGRFAIAKTRAAKRNFNAAEEFLKSIRGPGRSKVEYIAARHRLVSLLADDLKARKVNPTVGIITSNLGRLPEVFDNAYPGYRDSGLAWMVFARRDK